LDYGDKVCSTLGKCVTQDAVCFNSYTCDFRGFVCKSTLDEVAERHDALVDEYRSLGNDYDSLLQKAKSLASDHDDLVAGYDEVVDELEALKGRYNDALRARQVFSDCVRDAVTLDEAQRCY
jgi:predicted nuclease with TOPRIM domain